jgi:hypothetical protein
MEKFALAVSRFRRNRIDDCIKLCDELLVEKSDDLVISKNNFRLFSYSRPIALEKKTILMTWNSMMKALETFC